MENREILQTLLYSDLFDYPLTEKEIWKYLISEEKKDRKALSNSLSNLRNVGNLDNYYFIDNRDFLVDLRKKRIKESKRKIKLTKEVSAFLSFIPSIKLIGISGSLAMENADKDDDIDLFIVSSKGNIWSTRLLAICILKILGKHRGRNDEEVADKFCLNMIVSEESIKFPNSWQNLYTAHEIAQLKSVFQRDGAYERFVESNEWVKNFLPNFKPNKVLIREKNYLIDLILSAIGRVFSYINFEQFAKFIQLKYMKKEEKLNDTFLAFHPFDYRKKVLKAYGKKLADRTTRGH